MTKIYFDDSYFDVTLIYPFYAHDYSQNNI